MDAKVKRQLVKGLSKAGFDLQQLGSDLYFVRQSDIPHMFERLELEFAGSRNQTLVIGMALSVVKSTAVQFQGLTNPGGLEEFCTDPMNGRVELSAEPEADRWVANFVHHAPAKVREFARLSGPELLARTSTAREVADRVFARFERAGHEVPTDADEEQRRLAEALASLPFVIGSEDLRDLYMTAINMLAISGGFSIVDIARTDPASHAGTADTIDWLKSVPDEVIWKIRILVDLMLRHQASK